LFFPKNGVYTRNPPEKRKKMLISVLLAVVVVLELVLLGLALWGPKRGFLVGALQELFRLGREEAQKSARDLREEVAAGQGKATETLVRTLAEIGAGQKERLDSVTGRIEALSRGNEERLERLRETLEKQIQALREGNEQRLEQMRQTVDEKLQGTLEKRLGESFTLVTEQLDRVSRGLGEMRTLAGDVGNLQKVLTNVKARGTWGEVQLGAILEQMLSPEQYEANVRIKPASAERVEYAVRLPGREGDACVYLPIDAKFPQEDYLRLVEASEQGDPDLVQKASAALVAAARKAARDIREKYVAPPHSTDFGIMFLPVEGLYAELIRRSGFVEELQRDYRVAIAGPTTLAALLNSFQMGFRTLAIEKRSSEVWEILGAVKGEFRKFGDILDKVKKKLNEAHNTIEETGVRTRAIERKLRQVEELPSGRGEGILDLAPGDEDEGNAGAESGE